jgi:rhamnosyltransferase
VPRPVASVVIRTKDEAKDLGGVLDALAEQSVARETEIIVVDSGSSDGTVEIALGRGVRVLEIPAKTFSFGGALNTGCQTATSPVGIALSGHAYPPDAGWLERLCRHFDDERIACASGTLGGPNGDLLSEPVLEDVEMARDHPYWGYSNGAGGFRLSLWRQRPFRADMPGTEDKEWAWYWLQRGYLVALDPTLTAIHDHTQEPMLDNYRRARREWRGYSMYLDVAPTSFMAIARSRWTKRGPGQRVPRRRHLASLVGQYVERRRLGWSSRRSATRPMR